MSSLIQTAIWLGAGTCLFVFLRKRRTRRQQN
jgi:hypothetical protein